MASQTGFAKRHDALLVKPSNKTDLKTI